MSHQTKGFHQPPGMAAFQESQPLEFWGGVECTVNRVGASYLDQFTHSGHDVWASRDLRLLAQLGFRTLRTPLLWERFAAAGSWRSSDAMIGEMQRLGINPIAGLLHHGSGPEGTDLLDPEFPRKLAAYALQVARRYPGIIDYTPVNEPQTTARFSCLYGLWYPHHRTMESYLRALVNQIKGIVLSMQAIRSVQPAARLIHTEDGGETFSTPPLESYRVQREHRRWLGTDLLCGRVDRDHPLFDFLVRHGLEAHEILWFAANPCPPTVIGLNYYVTSDRFLDHRVHLYPWEPGGDTGTEPLVDVEAVRIRPEGIAGAASMLRQAWQRYRLPLAITEAHLGCEPAEQMRWLAEVWHQAQSARASGVDVRAVTAWALLGSYNWSNLCTADTGVYEPGVFDISSGEPAATPLAGLAYRLLHGLPVGDAAPRAGWWHRPDRFTIQPPAQESDMQVASRERGDT